MQKCEDDETEVWFDALVRDLVEPKDDAIRTEYNIIYTDYPGEVWTFNLLRDLKNRDLIVKD